MEATNTPQAPTHTVWVVTQLDDDDVQLAPTSVFGTLGQCRKHCRQTLGTLMQSDVAEREYLEEQLDYFFQEVFDNGQESAQLNLNVDLDRIADFTNSYPDILGGDQVAFPLLLVVAL